jgi:hypothetical protein
MAKINYDTKEPYVDGSTNSQYFRYQDANEIKTVVNSNEDDFTGFQDYFKLTDLILYGKSTQSGTPTPTSPVTITSLTGDLTVNLPNSETITISIDTAEICNIQDYKDEIYVNCLNGEVVKFGYINKFTLDNTWEITTASGTVRRFNIKLTNCTLGDSSHPNAMSTHYQSRYGPATNGNVSVSSYGSADNATMSMTDNRFSSVADFKTWLSTNPVTMYNVNDKPVKTVIGSISVADINKLKALTISDMSNVTFPASSLDKILSLKM